MIKCNPRSTHKQNVELARLHDAQRLHFTRNPPQSILPNVQQQGTDMPRLVMGRLGSFPSSPPAIMPIAVVLLLVLLLQLATASTPRPAFAPPSLPSGLRKTVRQRAVRDQQQPQQQPRPRRPQAVLLATSPSSSSGSIDQPPPLLTRAEIEACAADFGIELSLTTLGPFYRVVARLAGDSSNTEAMGYTEGFVAPLFGLVHLDTMQVRRRYWKQLQRDGKRQFRFGVGGWIMVVALFSRGRSGFGFDLYVT